MLICTRAEAGSLGGSSDVSALAVHESDPWRYSRDSSSSMVARVAERRLNTLRTFCSSRAVSVRLPHRARGDY